MKKAIKKILFPALIVGILVTGVVAGMAKPNSFTIKELLSGQKETPAPVEPEIYKGSETIYSVAKVGNNYEIVIKREESFFKQIIDSDFVIFEKSERKIVEYEFSDPMKSELLKATISAPSEDWVAEDCPNFVE